MNESAPKHETDFQAYLKAVQYLAGMTVHQDLWSESVSLMLRFLGAEFAAVSERGAEGGIVAGPALPYPHPLLSWLAGAEAQGIIAEVFDTGFFADTEPACAPEHKVISLPISSENCTPAVLTIGYRSPLGLTREQMNGCLAIAGIIGTTHSRLSSERELRLHRNVLEELVWNRTSELNETILKLEREVLQRSRAESAMQRMNEELEQRVAERTEEMKLQNEQLRIACRELKLETEERIRALDQLRENERLLIQQSRQAAMGEMIGNIAHQWRQPLNSLGLTIQQLELFYEYGEFTKELLSKNVGVAMDLVRHMSRTIDDFRNYFRPDREKIEFTARDAVAKTLSLIEDSFRQHRIAVEVVEKDEACIFGYPNEFSQALLNIMLNARDVLAEREIEEPRVTVNIGREAASTVVVIADNAGGVPEEIIDKIFDPYFTTKGPQQGTGIGLFMSKTIIEKNMSGRFTVSNLADGAHFRIEI